MCILSLFNFYPKLTLKEVAEHMGFDEETAKKNMHAIVGYKPGRVLKVEDGVFSVNHSFKSPMVRIVLPVPVLEEIVKKEKIT